MLWLTLVVAGQAKGDTIYAVKDLGVQGREATGARINERGHVLFGVEAESWLRPRRHFFWNGDFRLELTWTFTAGFAVDDSGSLVGGRLGPGETTEVFRFTPANPNQPPDGVIGTLDGSDSRVLAVNNNGVYVGAEGSLLTLKAVYGSSQNQPVELGTLGGDYSMAVAINDSGRITGFATTGATLEQINQGASDAEAFIYDHGQMTGLGTLGGPISYGRAINESGQIVGDSTLADSWLPSRESHAFLYDPVTGMQDIGIPGKFSVAHDINDLGIVAGQEYDPLGLVSPKAFLYDHLSRIQYLDDLFGSQTQWTSFRSATGINNRGQIVGTGLINGEIHIFLATPVPEPTSLLLALVATFAASLRYRRRKD